MRVLVKNPVDDSLLAITISQAWQDTQIVITDECGSETQEFSFESVLILNTISGDQICIVMPEYTSGTCLYWLVKQDFYDFTEFAGTTFVFPDDSDITRLQELSAAPASNLGPISSFS